MSWMFTRVRVTVATRWRQVIAITRKILMAGKCVSAVFFYRPINIKLNIISRFVLLYLPFIFHCLLPCIPPVPLYILYLTIFVKFSARPKRGEQKDINKRPESLRRAKIVPFLVLLFINNDDHLIGVVSSVPD